jgi:hypothetical protein
MEVLSLVKVFGITQFSLNEVSIQNDAGWGDEKNIGLVGDLIDVMARWHQEARMAGRASWQLWGIPLWRTVNKHCFDCRRGEKNLGPVWDLTKVQGKCITGCWKEDISQLVAWQLHAENQNCDSDGSDRSSDYSVVELEKMI